MTQNAREARIRRHERVRKTLSGRADKPRLSIFRSLNHIYVQLIDDTAGKTLVSASTLDAELKDKLAGKKKAECAGLVGELVAKRAKSSRISQVVFDRGGYKYHGRVKSLADGARKAGLKF